MNERRARLLQVSLLRVKTAFYLQDGTQVAGYVLTCDAEGRGRWLPPSVSVGITIGDGVNAITTGFKGAIWVPISGTITEWTVLSTDANPPTVGSIEIDILRSTYADYPTMTSMVGTGTKPNITNAQKGNGAPTGWASTSIAAGDCIGFQVTSVTGLKRVSLVLKVVKS